MAEPHALWCFALDDRRQLWATTITQQIFDDCDVTNLGDAGGIFVVEVYQDGDMEVLAKAASEAAAVRLGALLEEAGLTRSKSWDLPPLEDDEVDVEILGSLKTHDVELCEWDPYRGQPAETVYSPGGQMRREGCTWPATISLGRNGDWHLCSSCASLKRFRGFKVRQPLGLANA